MVEQAVTREGHKYLPAVDGLRAVAVLAVIANHFDPAILPSGYLGVDVFFVISGFVITLALLDMPARTTGGAIAEFYARRVKRLVPALALAVVSAALAIRLFDPDLSRALYTGLLALFGASNFVLFYQALDYFGPNAQLDPFMHTWSLGVEEQFYALYPALLLIGGRDGRFGLRSRLWLVGGLSAASVIAFILTYPISQPAAYFLLPFRFWELGLGCMIALLATLGRLGGRGTASNRPVTFVLVLLLGAFFVPETMPVSATILAVALSAALIVLVWRSPGGVLARSFVVNIGLLSYSLYLWHWIVLCISRWTIGISMWTAPLQLAVIFALAWLSYRYVENPLRRRQWFSRRSLTIIAGLALLGTSAGVLLLSQRFDIPRFSGSADAPELAEAPIVPGYVARHSGLKYSDCVMDAVYSDDPQLLARHLAACSFARGPDLPHLTFVGDSHSGDMFPVADLLFASGRAATTSLTEPSCQVPAPEPSAKKCQLAMRYLAGLPPVGSGESTIVIRNNISPKGITGELGRYVQSLQALAVSLTQRGYAVVYVAPAPKFYAIGSGAICSRQWFRPRWALDRNCRNGFVEPVTEERARRAEFMQSLERLQRTVPGFHVFDPFGVLCGANPLYCSPMREGHLIYRDDSHLTERGAELVYPPLAAYLEQEGLIAAAPDSR